MSDAGRDRSGVQRTSARARSLIGVSVSWAQVWVAAARVRAVSGPSQVQLGRELGARIIGTGRAADRDTALGLGVDAFLDLQADHPEDAGEVDVVFDVIGGDILDRSTQPPATWVIVLLGCAGRERTRPGASGKCPYGPDDWL